MLRGVERAPLAFQLVAAVRIKLGRGHIEGDVDIVARLEAGSFDRRHDEVERLARRGEVRGEAAFVANRGGVACGLERCFQRVEDLGAHAQGFGEVRRADRRDHELLDVDRIVGMRAAIEDVHHRHRQQRRFACRRDSDRAARSASRAAALAVASDTPRMALAPSRFLFSVPSRSRRRWSIARWSPASSRSARCGSRRSPPPPRASRPCRHSACRRRGAHAPHARRSRRRRAPRRGRRRRSPAPRPPRRWGCRGCREFPGRRR